MKHTNKTRGLKVFKQATTNLRRERGFTIVELLIVVIVIAILATVSIVAFGITQGRARATKAQSNATQVQKSAETHYRDLNTYPTTTAMFGNSPLKLPAEILILKGASTLSAANGETSVLYRYVGTAPNATGACIFYWDYTQSPAAVSDAILLGSATTSNCQVSGSNGTTPTT